MGKPLPKPEVLRSKLEAQENAHRVYRQDMIVKHNQVDYAAFTGASKKAQKHIQRAADRIGIPAWVLAFEVALELAKERTNDLGIEAPYHGLALLQEELKEKIAAADGFMAAELEENMPQPDPWSDRDTTPSA